MPHVRKETLAIAMLLVGIIGCSAAGPEEAVVTSAAAVCTESYDWHDFPGGQQCVGGVDGFFSAHFNVGLPPLCQYATKSGCSSCGACEMWVANAPDPNVWVRMSSGTPQLFDMIVFPPTSGNSYGHIAAVDHVDASGNVYVMDDNYVGYQQKAGCPHTVSWGAYGWYRLKSLEDRAPEGSLDVADCTQIAGWAADPDTLTQAIKVDLYFGGPAGSGSPSIELVAGNSRSDLCSAIGSCDHGFSLPTPPSLMDGAAHQVFAYGIDPSGTGGNPLLPNGPKTFTCAPPALPYAAASIQRYVSSPAIMTAWRLTAWDVATLSDAVLAPLPEGANLPTAPSLVTSDDGQSGVFIQDGIILRHVQDPASMTAWRFSWSAIVKMPRDEFYALPEGAPWPEDPFFAKGSNGQIMMIDTPPAALPQPQQPGAGEDAGPAVLPPMGIEPDGGADAASRRPPSDSGAKSPGGCAVSPSPPGPASGAWVFGAALAGLAWRSRARRTRLGRAGREIAALWRLVPMVLAVVLGSACGTTPPPPGAAAPATNNPIARFTLGGDATPSFMDVPFPSDVYLQGGKIIDPIPGIDAVFRLDSEAISHALGQMTGFSRVSLAMFYVDDPSGPPDAEGNIAHAVIDPASLPQDETACVADSSATFVIDLDATSPAAARVGCRAEFHDDTPRFSRTRPLVAIGPARGIVLSGAHRYAAVMTSRVKDTMGRAVTASADFAGLVAGAATGPIASLYGPAIQAVQSALGTALATDGATVVAIAPFTTHDMTKDLFQMRDTVEDLPVTPLAWDAASMAPMGAARFARKVNGVLPAGFTASLDDWLGVVAPTAKLPDGSDDPDDELPVRAHDKIAAVGSAIFEPANFLVHKPAGYSDLDDATLARDASGKVVPAPGDETEKIWVTIAIPTAPMPPTGYPVVIVQHGLSSSRAYVMSLANVFCAAGWVVVAIDSLTFGARAPEPMYQIDQDTDYQSAPGAQYKGPDGFADAVNGSRNGPADLFGELTNISAMRDQLRQSEIDTSQLVKLLRSGPDLSPLRTGATIPKLDPGRIAYVGDSLGAIEGAAVAAVEPYVKSWTLDVVGGEFIAELAPHAPSIAPLFGLAGAAIFGFQRDYLTESHPLVAVMQALMEPGDPIDYASYLVTSPGTFKGATIAPRDVLQTEVLYDEIVANESGEAWARAAGLGLATPNVGSNAGVVDLRHPGAGSGKVPLADVSPDGAGLIHDTPVPGVTAVVVQQSPGEHGSNLVSSRAQHAFAIPYALYDTAAPFTPLAPNKMFDVDTGYRQLQATIVRFVADGFAGRVPNVTGFKPPVRDFDGDGATDDVDRDPSDPTVQ